MTPLKSGDFATVLNNKKMKGSGLQRGDEVYVVNTRPAPEKRSDPYLQRIYVGVLKVEDDLPLIPNSEVGEKDNGHRIITVDPRNLEIVSEERSEKLNEALKKKYE